MGSFGFALCHGAIILLFLGIVLCVFVELKIVLSVDKVGPHSTLVEELLRNTHCILPQLQVVVIWDIFVFDAVSIGDDLTRALESRTALSLQL